MLGEQRILNTFLVVIQAEGGLLGNRLTLLKPFRYIKANATAKQRRQRSHFHPHACGRQINGNPAVFPEANVAGDQAIVWRIDKQLIADATLLRIKGTGFHRSDTIATEQNRIARTKLTGFFAVEYHADPFGIRRRQRRRIQQIILFQFAAFITRLQFNVGARKQRP